MRMPADGVSGATKAPGRHAVTVSGARLSNLPAGDYALADVPEGMNGESVVLGWADGAYRFVEA